MYAIFEYVKTRLYAIALAAGRAWSLHLGVYGVIAAPTCTNSNTELTENARQNIRLLLEQCNVEYEITPFDKDLYQDCIQDAIQRGYPMNGQRSVLTHLRDGVMYAATACVHIRHRPTLIWIAQYTSCAMFVNDVTDNFIEDLPNIYRFNDRFIFKQPHGSNVLDVFSDILRRASGMFRPIASQQITTSTMRGVIATALEHETKSMTILSAAQEYPSYQRTMSGLAEAYAFMVFEKHISLNEYIQAIPEIMLFIHSINGVLSFYKDEISSETTNHISTLAAQTKTSKLDAHAELTQTTIDLYQRILQLLEGAPEACEAFKQYTGGYIRFHTSVARYRLKDLGL